MVELKRYTLGRARCLDFLEKLTGSRSNNLVSLYWPQAASPVDLESHLRKSGIPTEISLETSRLAAGSVNGVVFFRSDDRYYLFVPPFPVSEKHVFFDSIQVEEIHSLLTYDYMIALVLVRLGSCAVGICRGEKLISSKIGTGLVHGRHRQGGSSAHRFERHRDKQIEYFLTRVCRYAREHIEHNIKSLDYIAYGGARTTILTLQKQCDFLGKIDIPVLPPLLDIPDPRQPVLEASISRIWSSTVLEWRENG